MEIMLTTSIFCFKWWAYWRTYHGQAGKELVAKALKEKCVSSDMELVIGNIESLQQSLRYWMCAVSVWKIYCGGIATHRQLPVVQDNKQYGYNSNLLPAENNHHWGQDGGTTEDAHQRADPLTIMGRMPAMDWKQWAVNTSVWIQEEVEVAFERLWNRSGNMH
jgi:hypothetical protein